MNRPWLYLSRRGRNFFQKVKILALFHIDICYTIITGQPRERNVNENHQGRQGHAAGAVRERMARRREDGEENLRNCPAYEMLEALEGRDRWGYEAHFRAHLADDAYWSQDEDCRLGHVDVLRWNVDHEEYYATREGMMPHRKLADDETEQVKDFLREEVEKFQKRLRTYLKRYGLSKCHYGVYWADR